MPVVIVSKHVNEWQIYIKFMTYPHGCVQRPCNLIVLFQPRTASQNLRQPELTDGALHVPNLSLRRRGCPGPLRWLTTNTAHHVGMGEGLWCALIDLGLVHLTSRLCDARMKRRGPVGDYEIVLVATRRSRCTRTRPRGEGRGHRGECSVVDIRGSMSSCFVREAVDAKAGLESLQT